MLRAEGRLRPRAEARELPRKVQEQRALAELEAVYRKVAEVYQGYGCTLSGECCHFAKTGREPYLWPIEWLRLKKAIATRGAMPPARADGACRLLSPEGRCGVYADRPFGCRTFYCDRFTGPSKLPRQSVHELSRRLADIGERLDPDCGGPVVLTTYLKRGL